MLDRKKRRPKAIMKIMDPSSKRFVQDEGHYWNNGRRPSFCLPTSLLFSLPVGGYALKWQISSLNSDATCSVLPVGWAGHVVFIGLLY